MVPRESWSCKHRVEPRPGVHDGRLQKSPRTSATFQAGSGRCPRHKAYVCANCNNRVAGGEQDDPVDQERAEDQGIRRTWRRSPRSHGVGKIHPRHGACRRVWCCEYPTPRHGARASSVLAVFGRAFYDTRRRATSTDPPKTGDRSPYRRARDRMVILSAFADEISADPVEQLDVPGASTAFAHVEFRSIHGIERARPRRPISSPHFATCSFSIGASASQRDRFARSVRSAIDDPFEPHLERFEHAIDRRRVLSGLRNIRVFSFYLPPGP